MLQTKINHSGGKSSRTHNTNIWSWQVLHISRLQKKSQKFLMMSVPISYIHGKENPRGCSESVSIWLPAWSYRILDFKNWQHGILGKLFKLLVSYKDLFPDTSLLTRTFLLCACQLFFSLYSSPSLLLNTSAGCLDIIAQSPQLSQRFHNLISADFFHHSRLFSRHFSRM